MGNILRNKKLEQISSINVLENIKSKYMLMKIFDTMKKNKKLEIIKYNKILQKRIDLNINDYKEYSQLYSSIEIELKVIANKYGEFINIRDEVKEYYHIYFDNSKKEIKRNYLKEKEKVKTIKIRIDYQVKSFQSLFYGYECISSLCFKKFYRNNITDMGYMFFRCLSLKELNISNFNTDNVNNMSYMFSLCLALNKIDLPLFNSNNVIDMGYMFFGCVSLKDININNLNKNNIININSMFIGCSDELKK